MSMGLQTPKGKSFIWVLSQEREIIGTDTTNGRLNERISLNYDCTSDRTQSVITYIRW